MTATEDIQLAAAALAAIGDIVKALKSARMGKIDPQAALAAITRLSSALADNDAAADQAAEAKFPAG